MRILHTADWHLGDRLGRIDRTAEIENGVEQIATYLETEKVDLLLIAGDLFSELARTKTLRNSIRHWQDTFSRFLANKGTILAITGNHDNEVFCQTLQSAMTLAAPISSQGILEPGRLYLSSEPGFIRFCDPRSESTVHFVLMPYPTPSIYSGNLATKKPETLQEKTAQLEQALYAKLEDCITQLPPNKPAILVAHLNVTGLAPGTRAFRMGEDEAIFNLGDFSDRFAYIALGHIHKPICINGHPHIRYSGSIAKLDLGEKDDQKQVVIFDIDDQGLQDSPAVLPLKTRNVILQRWENPTEELALLLQKHPEGLSDLVKIEFVYSAKEDNLDNILQQINQLYPNWYSRDWQERNELRDSLASPIQNQAKGFRETVKEYVATELQNHPHDEREELQRKLDDLLVKAESKS